MLQQSKYKIYKSNHNFLLVNPLNTRAGAMFSLKISSENIPRCKHVNVWNPFCLISSENDEFANLIP